ncbi:hypothetical protein WKW79_36315 [Variovorax robiniae]|uniref:Uncharacterized protein n=1 Tax=Variovorax robiniae TaxID=1836199 RepID=A0ABU8XKC5_9BURK
MTRFIGQVLGFEAAGQRQPAMTITDVDVARVLEDVLDDSRTAYPGMTIVHDVPGSLGMPADADRLAQLFSISSATRGSMAFRANPLQRR